MILSGRIEGAIYLEDQVELVIHAAATERFADPSKWIDDAARIERDQAQKQALSGIF